MEKLFGASWVPSLLGYLIGGLTELDLFFKNGGAWPSNRAEWFQFAIGIGTALFGRFTRQTNVSSEQEGVK